MEWIALFVLMLFAALLALGLRRRAAQAAPLVWPFYPKRPLSEVEQTFYWRLTKSLPEYVILPQVQLSRFLGVKHGHAFHAWNNRINRMSVDYLICRKDFFIVAAVELDDATHGRPDRIQADAKKDKALRDAGLRLIRWPVMPLPDSSIIRAALAEGASETDGKTPKAASAPRVRGEDRLTSAR